jgi:hypothetical protein
MAEGSSGSSNTAIVAIFVIVVLLALGFLFFRGVGGSKTEVEVKLPEVSQGSGNRGTGG